MGVPKKHTTKGSRNQRRMHIFLDGPTLIACQKCGRPSLPHTMCENCGYYKGVEILNVLAKLEKKDKKKREKEIQETEKKEKEKQKPLTLAELSRKKF